jgi:hypothetical protein
MKQNDQEFEQRVKASLDAGDAALDGETRRRLAAMRARALQRPGFFARWLPMQGWVSATSFAAITVLVVSLFVLYSPQENPAQVAQLDGDLTLEVLFGDDGHDAESDPDFYLWMEAEMLFEEEEKNAG